MGSFIELRYESHGKPHTIAMRGANRANVDKEKIVRVCKAISDGQGEFFGGLPFSKYVWHFAITPGTDGGGGLEHLTSTQISLAQGVGPRSRKASARARSAFARTSTSICGTLSGFGPEPSVRSTTPSCPRPALSIGSKERRTTMRRCSRCATARWT